jgi:hypothetical protein
VTKVLTAWALCPACRRTRQLSASGLLAAHRAWVPSLRGEAWPFGEMRQCDGSGRPPAVAGDTAVGRRVQTVETSDAL